MIVKALGILDVFIAVCFWIFGVFGFDIMKGFILILGLILLVKGIIFIMGFSISSFLDIVCALVIIASVSVNVHMIIVFIVAIYLLQKGIFSFWA